MMETIKIQDYNIKSINSNDYLWKFISIEKFLSIILNRKLFFTRLDKFEDTLEGIEPEWLLLDYAEDALLNLPFKTSSFPYNLLSTRSDSLMDKLHETQKYNYANCWFLSSDNVESVAMWNLYSKPNSVALNIKFGNFIDKIKKNGIRSDINIKNFMLGGINYIDFQNPIEVGESIEKLKFTPFIKDKSFRHENEFRMIAEIENYKVKAFEPKPGISKYKQKKIYDITSQIHGVNIWLNNFLEYDFEIVFHPKIESWVKDDIFKILEKFEIPFNSRESKLKS